MEYPSDRRYTKDHEWVKLEGDIAIVGITSYAQDELGELVFVELPEINSEVQKGSAVSVVESSKAASDVYTPVSGIVTEINDRLQTDATLVNSDPHGEGWLFKLKLSDPSELDTLMSAEEYRSFIESQH